MPIWNSYSFQDANSPVMEQLTFFHDSTMMILTAIITIISYLLIYITFNKLTNRYLLNSQNIELLWTITPAVTLLFIALPSLKILYLMDDITNPMMTIKAIGHQWYWSYEYSDFKNIEFESYMKLPSEMNENEFRLLETNNRTILPIHTSIRLLTTSTDVIHSWTVPSLGVKIDAIPGRLNQSLIIINRPGLMYGQCSEICGANHSFMPIVLESINIQSFIKWMNLY
ncbi:cytochrome c oxidase subunit II (mitochondrion) [Cimex lectularius]|uniref:Cytochrome c oxidase subunit 2 n=1 Tax=Cimex lectularius TaxID=79782 RepID=A0A342KAC9_CIMLE|nr:cytochrome c oxidase subunit II [Cimex lectularius]AFI23476.1 cytochrome c oxidase subunit II [Cimex lectularius]AMY59992.1 cytochrome c oxidase subunit II [Cimex lectularius]